MDTNEILQFLKSLADRAKAGDQDAAYSLMQIALFSTELIDMLEFSVNPEVIKEVARDFDFYPISVSGIRRENSLRLKRALRLPIGEKRPFRSAHGEVGPATKLDNIRSLIMHLLYPVFEAVRLGYMSKGITSELAARICALPPLTKTAQRRWVTLWMEFLETGPGFNELLDILQDGRSKQRNTSKRTKRISKRHGGLGLVQRIAGSKARFYDQAGNELDFLTAQGLSDKTKEMEASALSGPSRSEMRAALTDSLNRCLKTALKR